MTVKKMTRARMNRIIRKQLRHAVLDTRQRRVRRTILRMKQGKIVGAR